MKKFITIALVLVLTLCLFTGCRTRQNDTSNTGAGMTNGEGNNMLPDAGDTIDPTNGANDDTDNNTGTNQTVDTNKNTENTTDDTSDNTRSRSKVFPGH